MTFNELRKYAPMYNLASWDVPVLIKDGDKLYPIKLHLSEENDWHLEIEKGN